MNNNMNYCHYCMIKRTLNGMYVMFYSPFGSIIRYYNKESAVIIGELDTDIRSISKSEENGLFPDGEVIIGKVIKSVPELIELFEDIENVYFKEISKLQLNK